MLPKKYALTKLGDPKNRRSYSRRDANCPVITHARRRGEDLHVAVPAWLVNLSEDGCQITSDHFPSGVDEVYLIIPGLGSKVHGKAKAQGKFTLHVEFSTLLTTEIVDKVGRMKVVAKR